jgi:SAM-dependent methyltransferase
MQFLKRQREEFLDRISDQAAWQNRLYSGTTYSLWLASAPLLAAHCRGLVLDAGSGRCAWRATILRTASGYESIDIAPRGAITPTWIGDITSMSAIEDARFHTVVCQQVLEHVRRPWLAMAEFNRVLKPAGKLIVSIPHLSRRHELPHDYFRFTQEGLGALLEDAGFRIVEVQPFGGVNCFLHHQVSFLVPGLLLGVPILGALALRANAILSWVAVHLDRLVDTHQLLPTGVIAVAQKA